MNRTEGNLLQNCLVAFGSNLGDSRACFAKLVATLLEHPQNDVVLGSELIETEPIGGPDGQRAYLNGCLRIATHLEVDELFYLLRLLEDELGRERRERWGARQVDLDLLLFGDRVVQLEDPRLVVPHPRMSFRRFVLEPANYVASDLVHAPSGLTVRELLARLDQLPDQVALVVSDQAEKKFEAFVKSMAVVCRENGYQFFSGECDQLLGRSDEIKLLLRLFEDDSEVVQPSARFAGASLMLAGSNLVASKLELAAALQAMKPLVT